VRDLVVPGGRRIPERCLSVQFARGGGPGGQNVNKVASKVDLRLDLTAAIEALGDADVARIRERLATRLDADGRLQVTSNEHRSQQQNLDAALRRMEMLLAAALKRDKVRRPTRPTSGSRIRRLTGKKLRGEIKRGRGDQGRGSDDR
jgi:ribosome-associated protein